MSRANISKEVTWKNSNEGTAARTRPVSLEEILSRRKNKLDTDVKEGANQTRESSEKDDKGISSDRGIDGNKDTKGSVKGDSKRLEEETSKKERLEGAISRKERLGETISKMEQEHFQNKDTGNHDSETKTKVKSSYSKSSRDKESKNEKQTRHRSRNSHRTGADSEKESEKKPAKISKEKDKHEEREGKSGKEGKRKHGSHIDDKNRFAVAGSIPKKHDCGKLHDAEYSERKDKKKEHSRTHHEEPRAKRRRSSSWEHDRGRDRSASISPRAHRRSNHRRDHDEAIFQSSKEKSRKKYSDAGDMYRISGNGGYSSGHYRKHGSGLGGYSPRKRRTEAAKTPSPMKHSPEKKISTWDQPPAGTNHGGFGSMLTNKQSPTSKMLESTSSTTVTQNAVTPSMTKPHPIIALDRTPMAINASIEAVQLTQATRPMRRLYIENLPPSASEKSVIDCLNDFLLSSGVNRIQGVKPCINCIINKEKHQAVVEFLTPEDATSAISFDGRSLSGSVLKIRRPKDFVEAATGAQEKTVPTVKAMSEVVKDSPHKIFIGGISKALSSEMLLEIAGAFGLLRAYHFEFNEELNGPCAFLEYEDHSITHKACAGLNGMKLGGHVLTAVQAFLDSPGIEDDAENLPSYDIPSHAKPLLADPTQVLQLKNVFTPEEFPLLTDSELDEILEDIKLECARFGTVKSINLVPFNKSEGASEGSDQQEIQTESANCKNHDVDVPTSSNVKEQQDVRDATEKTNTDDKSTGEDYEMKESASLSPVVGDNSQMEDPCSIVKGTEINVEEAVGLEGGTVPEVTIREVDVAGEEIADLTLHAINGEGEQIPVQTTSPSVFVTDEGKPANGESNHLAYNLEVFEPGCVLIEFLRKEAACAAAHSLHRRSYGEQIVSVSYVSHELYMTRFPR